MPALTVPGVLDSLGILRRFITEAAAGTGLDDKALYQLTLAVDEIATNIVAYGYEGNGLTGEIVITAETTPAEFVVTLTDTAPAFDPRQRTAPSAEDLARPLEERPIGGLGVMLALQGVDRFDYEWTGKGNRNIFAVNRNR